MIPGAKSALNIEIVHAPWSTKDSFVNNAPMVTHVSHQREDLT